MTGKLRNLKSFLSAFWWLFFKSGAKFRLNSGNSILFISDNTLYAPYLPGMVNDFNQGEWCTWLFNPHLILTIHLKARFHSGRFSICLFKHKQSRRIYLGSQEHPNATCSVSADFFNTVARRNEGEMDPDECLLPFVMHASQYQHMRRFEGAESRAIRIFFSGNSDLGSYGTEIIHSAFDILNRHEIKQFITSQFKHLLNSKKAGDESKPLWWIDWQWKPGQRGGYDNRIENDEWFSFLDRSAFFLACPGVRMPMCHNLIEAMYCGSIPILQHPKLFNPPLEHGLNCLVFNSRESLKKQIETALSMDEEKVRELQKEVKQYYNAYLSPEYFKSVLTNQRFKRYYFQVNQVSTQLWSEQNNAPLRVW